MNETLLLFLNGKEITDTKVNTSSFIMEKLNLTSKENFILTNVLSYTNYISPLNMTSTELGNKFNQLFNLDIYQDIYQNTLKEARHNTEKLKNIENKIQELNKTLLNEKMLIDNLSNYSNKSKIFKEEIKNLETECVTLEVNIGKINIPSNKNIYTKQDLQELKIFEPTRTIQDLYNELSVLKVKLKEFKSYNEIKTNKTIEYLSNKLDKLVFKPVNKVVSLEEYNEINNKERYSPDIFIDDLKELKNKKLPEDLYNDLLEFLDELNSKEYLEDAISIIDYNNALYNNTINKEITNIKSKMKYLINLKIDEVNKELENHKNIELKEEIEQYFKNEELLKEKEILIEELRRLKKVKKNKEEELVKNERLLIENEILSKNNLLNNEMLSKLKEELILLKKQEMVYNLYKETIKTLPKKILVDTIKLIEKEANKLIYKMIGIYVLFSMEETWELLIKKGKMILGTEHLSGAERFIVNVILKMTLDKYKYYCKSGLFIIDECADSVSEENTVNKMNDVFDILRKEYKNIFIISHNEYLKNMVDYRIEITSDFTCSKIS
jgi:DNA repair exonuclease SbcCD ATPase subunit